VKLLYEEHLPRSLVRTLGALYPGSAHVVLEGLEAADDIEIWEFAKRRGFVIVSKDADFDEHSAVRGHPPRVVWIRIGNCSTRQIVDLLRAEHATLLAFEKDDSSILVLG